jgi:hypothetical protein
MSNLLLVNGEEHNRYHALKNHNFLRFMVQQDWVTEIIPLQKVETYDIKCLHPYNNYIANNIAVHNSGKTTLSLHAIAAAQKRGETAAFIDVEHAFDPNYAEALGINVEQLAISQPKEYW